ncbi:hypothetical protein HC031_11520 [Planosporangium thailandense]|uniref:PPE family domain-containing protein n=1 Tax=Planosporangium thailandense TaxID=765197 RepID=A0ABX0XWC4_9ACTN|nr:hypothetical protein [Planosporangium thailandense]NJC70335.1 hypothetical protein [Planosporangium thailandense]
MIPSDVSGGTAWEMYDIHTIHSMVDGVTDDQIQTSWDQVMAWRKTQQLLDEHAATLTRYRQDLVGSWSPEKNAASAAFVQYVDDLIQSLQQSSKAADDNVRALSELTSAVETARTEVKKAYQEYSANQSKLQAASAKPAPSGTPTPSPSPSPSPAPPPVAPGRQEQLTQQARSAMATLAGTASYSAWRMTVPPPYTPPNFVKREESQHLADPSVVTAQPPVVPAPRSSTSQFDATTPYVPGGAVDQNPPANSNVSLIPSGGSPVLAGNVITPPTPGLTPHSPGFTPIPSPPGGVLPPDGPMAFTPGLRVIGSRITPGDSVTPRGGSFEAFPGRGPRGAVPAEEVPPRTLGGGRALPPGGVIGKPPAVGAVEPFVGGGRPSAGVEPRVNPVGGVLGQTGAPAGRTSGSVGNRGTTTGQSFLSGRRAGKSVRGHDSGGWDPDDPWAVEQGVTPVLEPGREQSFHDPGPGVIGIDR